jgi:hypothetical protein
MNIRVRQRHSLVVLVMLLALLVPGPTVLARNDNPGVTPPHAKAFGKSYEDWASAWWRWVVENPATNHPLLDGSGIPGIDGPGANCDAWQQGKVWFLAGNFGGTVERDCAIPSGKAIFFPVLNSAVDNVGPPITDLPPEELRSRCEAFVADPEKLAVTLDGQSLKHLEDYAIKPTLFSYTVPDIPDNIYRAVLGLDFAGDVLPPGAYSCGYYVMLAPLSKGEHTLHIEAENDGFALDVLYHLDIGAKAAKAPGKSRT